MDTGHQGDRSEGAVMTLGDHLDELRRRMIWAVALPLPVAVMAFAWAEPIRTFLCQPAVHALEAHNLPTQLQVLSPIETLGTDLKIALVTALVLGAPWILLQVWKFVEPGLYAHERRFVRLLLPMSAALTVSGLALLHFLLMPMMLEVLVSFGSEPPQRMESASTAQVAAAPAVPTLPVLHEAPAHPAPGQAWLTPDHRLAVAVPDGEGMVQVLSVPLVQGSRLAQQFRLSEYLDFTLDFALGTAIAFQTPLIVLLLGWLGVLTPQALGQFRRYAIFLSVLVSAIVTPSGDPFSLALLAVPIYGLYELGILLLRAAPPAVVARGEVFSRIVRAARGGT
ncbi:MAG: preprotein translocase subunit TatC [Planctomycetes bacterium]|nr:preprotein translocase subunit TatC [Planctomycetota bacterium]